MCETVLHRAYGRGRTERENREGEQRAGTVLTTRVCCTGFLLHSLSICGCLPDLLPLRFLPILAPSPALSVTWACSIDMHLQQIVTCAGRLAGCREGLLGADET